MKRFWKIMLMVAVMLVLVACADNSKDNPNNSKEPGESQTEDDVLNEQNPSTEDETEIETEDESIDDGEDETKGEICWVSGSVVNFRNTCHVIAELTVFQS